MPADQNEKKKKKKKTTIDTVPIDDLTSGEAQVAKKRKLGIESCEKIGNQQSPDGKSDESHKSCGKVASDDLRRAVEQDVEKGEKNGEIEQDKDVAPTSSRDDVMICERVEAAQHCAILPREKLDDSLSGAIIERDNERDINVNEINGVDATSESGLVNPLAQASQKVNEKFAQDAPNQLETNKLVEDYMKQYAGPVDPRSNSFSNLVDSLAEQMQIDNDNYKAAIKKNDVAEKLETAVESKEATLITDAEKLGTVNNLQAADALVQESKTLDHVEVGKDDVEMEAESVKTGKKRKSRKDKRRAKEGSLVALDVEPISVVVDGEEGSDSLKEKEENVEKSGKKSSKTLKKPSANVVEVVLGLPAINKPKVGDNVAKSKNPKQRKSSGTQ